MASRLRSLSRPTQALLKSAISKPSSASAPFPSLSSVRSSSLTALPRSIRCHRQKLGCVESLLPLHSAVSSARLISCLSIDSGASRSLSQGMLCGANPGV